MEKTLSPRFSSNGRTSSSDRSALSILEEETFTRMLCLERKRTERSGRRFVLMLLDAGRLFNRAHGAGPLDRILLALSGSTRETDIQGWYTAGSVIGVIFTEIGVSDGKYVAQALLKKVTNALCGALDIDQINEIRLSFHVFPDDWEGHGPGGPADSRLYPDLIRDAQAGKAKRVAKRTVDVVGSLFALVLFLPLFAVIAAAIKLTTPGPVFFRQTRLGQSGKKFTFFKFRSMQAASNSGVHEEYMKRLIAGQVTVEEQNGSNGLYKLASDARVTRVGKLLRRTSLDELPQFLNVLTGDMSLVGPRPPIPYEFDSYELWHRRRLLAVKPGITGPWQVGGRNKLRFEEMVRLDLEYSKSWTVWMDFKILLKTPAAVLSLDGAV